MSHWIRFTQVPVSAWDLAKQECEKLVDDHYTTHKKVRRCNSNKGRLTPEQIHRIQTSYLGTNELARAMSVGKSTIRHYRNLTTMAKKSNP